MKKRRVTTHNMNSIAFAKKNNIEWLRLAFALQVVIGHASLHLGGRIPKIIGYFPGVPAFFFVSGFLIYASYLNAPGVRYFQNRFLRLFPGLLFVSVGAIAVALLAHGFHDLSDHPNIYISWLLAQLTLGQAYNPVLFRDVGVGVLNGALWTLTTEILFYLIVPVIVRLERQFKHALPALIVLSLIVYVAGPVFLSTPIRGGKTIYDFLALTPLVWGWMFGFGILAVKYFQDIQRWIRYFPLAAIPMGVMIYAGGGLLFGVDGNRLGVAYFVCYVCIIFWLAFSTPYLPLKTDISYGTYIWHGPVTNFLLVLGLSNMITALALTMAIAVVSWYLAEAPALRLKRESIKPVSHI